MKSLKKTIVLTAAYYGRQLSDEIVNLYVQDLSSVSEKDAIEALNVWRSNPQNKVAPLPSNILQIVNPEKHIGPRKIASEIAGRVTAAVPKFGWANPTEAREYVGELGWSVVEDRGGWAYLCQHLGLQLNPSIFEAQCRDHVEARIEMAGGLEKAQLLASAPKQELPEKITEVLELAQKTCRNL